MCTRCILIPQEFEVLVTSNDVKFCCISCHWLKDRWAKCVTPYLRDGEGILPSFLKVNGRFELSTRSHILSPSTLLLHFHFYSITSSAPVSMIHNFLLPYFPHGGLEFVEIEFDLGSDEGIKAFAASAHRLVTELAASQFERVLVAVTNHTDNNSGDFFLGLDVLKGIDIAASVNELLYTLWTPFEGLLRGTILYLFACGSIHCEKESSLALHQSLARFWFSHAIAFDAPHLQPAITSHFLLGLTELPSLLGVIAMFVLGCPQCGTPQTWVHVKVGDAAYKFECKYRRCGWDSRRKWVKDAYATIIRQPDKSEILPNGKRADSIPDGFRLPDAANGSDMQHILKVAANGSDVRHVNLVFRLPLTAINNPAAQKLPFIFSPPWLTGLKSSLAYLTRTLRLLSMPKATLHFVQQFSRGKPEDMPFTRDDNSQKRKVGSSADEEGAEPAAEDIQKSSAAGKHSAASAASMTHPASDSTVPGAAVSKPKSAMQPSTPESDSPAAQTDCWSFITSLSVDRCFAALTTILAGLPKFEPSSSAKQSPIPKWAAWSWGFNYLPEDVHSQADIFRTAVAQLKNASWNSAARGTRVVLGFRLLLRECRRAQYYEEEDENSKNMVPPFLANSRLGIERMEEILVGIEALVAQRRKVEDGLTRDAEKVGDKEKAEEKVENDKVEDDKKTSRKETKISKAIVEVPKMPMKTLLKGVAQDHAMSEPTEATTEDQEDELLQEYQRPGPSKKSKLDSPAKNTRSKRSQVMTKRAQGRI
ncbi:hypothetical protein PAXINDRAFT_156256 [Paxillus involutus ATCC 200175]|uniref:Uncharacterized protein n=1 Tax=Paxillus involutus ATCC 200175 TaxID=664439 RepID=A0A0C9U3W5_PAXIN|nr:hypothetical protein PAXINDRAFT_156256 [Paxillus involutus ATCC 200175]